MSELRVSDVLVIGAGLAGERCAIEAAAAGLDVTLLSIVPPRRSHSCAAQGGMQAALANCDKGAGDSADIHYADTVRGSDWGADQEVVRLFAEEAAVAVRELAHWGVPWTRVKPGPNEYVIKGERVVLDEPADKAGLLMHRDFGGTAKWRTCYAAAGTGHAVLYAVDGEVVRLGIEVEDRSEALALIHDAGRCWGAVVRCLRSGRTHAHLAKATVIATGGHGRIYGQYTTNATINEGTGAAIALATGVVPLGNMEAVQFHPTTLMPSGILITEGCRGDGGFLLDREHRRFMVDLEPEKQELASRDVVSRHMMQRMRDGFGVQTPYGPHLWLDLRHLGAAHITTKLYEVYDICRDFLGLDPVTQPIPVRPAQHYSMGGIRVNKDGHAYGLTGLFAAGEASCWDLHGFNRLGGNSLAETIVAGRVVGAHVARFARCASLDVDASLATRALAAQRARIAALRERRGSGPGAYAVRDAIARIMIEKAGIFRRGDELDQAVTGLTEQLRLAGQVVLRCDAPGVNPELSFALRLEGLARLALVTALGAQARTESRGAHFREDHPVRDDAKWLNRTLARWPDGATQPTLAYEPVGLIDMPPGERGYGKAASVPMAVPVEQYNAGVASAWRRAGRPESVQAMGARLRRGPWPRAGGGPPAPVPPGQRQD